MVGTPFSSNDSSDIGPSLVYQGLTKPVPQGVVVSPHLRGNIMKKSMCMEDCMTMV